MIVGPAAGLLALDLWDAREDAAAAAALGLALPGPGQADGAGFDAEALTTALDGTGVVTPNAGGWVRVALHGAPWCELIMQSGLIDAEDPGFAPGHVAVTVLCHARCLVHVRAPLHCDIFVPASYAGHCLAHWRALGWHQIAA
jgi:hypothetical protein